MEIVLYTLTLIVSTVALVLALLTYAFSKENPEKKKEELPEEKETELDKAVDVIKAYCKGQTEEGRCAFNLNQDNKVCDCALLRTPPEEWHGNEDEKERAQ